MGIKQYGTVKYTNNQNVQGDTFESSSNESEITTVAQDLNDYKNLLDAGKISEDGYWEAAKDLLFEIEYYDYLYEAGEITSEVYEEVTGIAPEGETSYLDQDCGQFIDTAA